MADLDARIDFAERTLDVVRLLHVLERDLNDAGEQPHAQVVRLAKLELVSPALQGPFNDLPIDSSDLRP